MRKERTQRLLAVLQEMELRTGPHGETDVVLLELIFAISYLSQYLKLLSPASVF